MGRGLTQSFAARQFGSKAAFASLLPSMPDHQCDRLAETRPASRRSRVEPYSLHCHADRAGRMHHSPSSWDYGGQASPASAWGE
jgi:hypothetical protein